MVSEPIWATDHAIVTTMFGNEDIRYFRWILEAANLNQYAHETAAQPGLAVEKIRNIGVPFPSWLEQRRIADFLDAKTAEADELRSTIEQQIETLEAYKRSVMTETVTTGLHPGSSMKPSGVPWVGLVPVTWKVDKLKYHLKRFEPRNPGDAPVLSLYRELGIVLKDSRDDNHNVTSEDASKYKYVRPGDFVVNKMKAWEGSVAVSDYKGIVSPAYSVYRFTDSEIIRRYFHYLLRSCYKDEFMRLSADIRVGKWDLASEALDQVPIFLPPKPEQQQIVDFLDMKVSELDEVIEIKWQQLEVLNEYRKALIFEYATGKKEVPA